MKQKEWDKWEPVLKELQFGESLWSNLDNQVFIGKVKQWFQHGEVYLAWAKEENTLMVLRLEDEKELKYNEWVERAANKIKAKKLLPWYNITKYF